MSQADDAGAAATTGKTAPLPPVPLLHTRPNILDRLNRHSTLPTSCKFMFCCMVVGMGTAAYQLGNISSRMITEVKLR